MLCWKGHLSLFFLYGLLIVFQLGKVNGDTSSDEDDTDDQDDDADTDDDNDGDGCLDLGTNCQQIKDANLCTNDVYRQVVLQYCRETCDLCDDDTPVDDVDNDSNTQNCVDSSPSCFDWNRNGYCGSAFYTTEIKRSTCQKTCNLCVNVDRQNLRRRSKSRGRNLRRKSPAKGRNLKRKPASKSRNVQRKPASKTRSVQKRRTSHSTAKKSG